MDRVVAQLLAEIDGAQVSGEGSSASLASHDLFIIGATNRCFLFKLRSRHVNSVIESVLLLAGIGGARESGEGLGASSASHDLFIVGATKGCLAYQGNLMHVIASEYTLHRSIAS